MAKERKKPEGEPISPTTESRPRTGSRHKDRNMVSVRGQHYDLLRRLQEILATKYGFRPHITDLVHRGLETLLREHGLWPPPSKEE
jgi:hypothetical protein